MRIIKLSTLDEDMGTREEVIEYFTNTLRRKNFVGMFGLTEHKSRMKGVEAGTILLFSYQTECMFMAKAAGKIAHSGNWPYIPIDMDTLRPVSGSLRDLEDALHKKKLTRLNLVQSRNWPELPIECEPFVLNYFSPQNLASLSEPEHIKIAKRSLHKAMLALYDEAGKETGYWGRYYLRDVRTKGGFETARRMLQPRKGDKPHKGFATLLENGRADELSVEAIVLKKPFSFLFTADELEEAKRRLKTVPRQEAIPPDKIHAEEVDNTGNFIEGSVRQITVNAYERDKKARAACLNKYGCSCSVCHTNFEEEYGQIGKGFIHVHHKKPLALIKEKYKVNPILDLIPVCPNCHAMLHSKKPPLTVEQLRLIVATIERNR